MARELSVPEPLLNIIFKETSEFTKLNFHISFEAPPVRGSRFSIDPLTPNSDRPLLRKPDNPSLILINQNLNLRPALQNPIRLRCFDNFLEFFSQRIGHALHQDRHIFSLL